MKKKPYFQKVTDEEFLDCYNEQVKTGYGFRGRIAKELGLSNPAITDRIKRMKARGIIPLDTGVLVDNGQVLKGTSTLYSMDEDTKTLQVKSQWVKTNVEQEQMLANLRDAVDSIMDKIQPFAPIEYTATITDEDLLNLYLSNDIHLGALMWKDETGDRDWNTNLAADTYRRAIDYLIINSPSAKYGIVADLGDLTEMDDFKNATPHSGNALDVDGRYSKVLEVACDIMEYAIYRALEKHEIVYFINISGNHDITTGHAVRQFVYGRFKDNPRVIIDRSPIDIKYHLHGSTLLGFAHGDGLKMNKAGEVMASDNRDIFSQTNNNYFHFGHTHKDAIIDGALCQAISHRNIAPLNHWASHKGFRGSAGTMKCITYSKDTGYTGTTNYNVMIKEDK